jgi:opacity protein-like surface antigen
LLPRIDGRDFVSCDGHAAADAGDGAPVTAHSGAFMTTVTKSAPLFALAALVLFIPAAAQAQDQRLRISFAPAVATVSGDAELALGGTLGYRFSEHFWFEGDFTWIDAAAGGFRDNVLDFDRGQTNDSTVRDLITRQSVRFGSGRFPGNNFPNFPDLPGLGRMRASVDGRTLIGTLGVRYELPVQTARFRPYLAAGLGINDTEQDFRLEQTSMAAPLDDSVSHTGYAFNGGAGASVRLFNQLWADVDAKYFRLSEERNIMRLGGGVSFRF